MAKPLATILKKYSDVIAGKLPASEVNALTLGKEPGVDYDPKMADEREFVASHSVEKHPDRVGNGPDVYNGAKVKQAVDGRHGHIPNPKSKNTYTQANEEVELDETSGAKAERYKKAARSGLLHLAVHTKDGPDKTRKIVNRAAGMERADRAIDKDIAKRSTAQKKKLAKEETDLDEKYQGFEKTERALAAKGAENPKALAAWIGRKKYGKEKFQKAAAAGKKLKEAKDESEYGYEGDMAITQLKTICRNAEHLMKMLKPETDLPEWVQSKITKAEDYITTAHEYLMSEMNEAKVCENCGKSSCGCDDMPKKNKNKKLLLEPQVTEEATSQAQQKLMAMAYRYKQNPKSMPDASEQVKKLASTMTIKQLHDFAKTKRSELPKKVQKESATTPIKMPSNPSSETADYNSGYNLGRWTV